MCGGFFVKNASGGCQEGAGTEEIGEKPKSPYVEGVSEVPVRRN